MKISEIQNVQTPEKIIIIVVLWLLAKIGILPALVIIVAIYIGWMNTINVLFIKGYTEIKHRLK